MKVGRFVPPVITRHPLDEARLECVTGKRWTYVASGKAAIYHCLRATAVSGAVVVPIYACSSILAPLRGLGLEPVFADIDPVDLNISLESVKTLTRRRRIDAVIVPSIYGNPAALDRFEAFCRDQAIVMIDDAAQSLGARLEERSVGTFGDAGFFSFSPGKATAGHGGGFFWTNQPYAFSRTAHPLIHRLKWMNFYWSRLRAYDSRRCRRLLVLLDLLATRLDRPALWNDRIEAFEEPILGGILDALFSGRYAFRMEWHERFVALLASTPIMRLVSAKRGFAHPHKLVLVTDSPERARDLRSFLAASGIFSAGGYLPLVDAPDLPGWRAVEGRVVELAIDEDMHRMECQYDALRQFIEREGR